MKILHLEDDPAKAAIIWRHMAGLGVKPSDVTWVTNEDAYCGAIARTNDWGLLILDNCVPPFAGHNGPKACGNESVATARDAGYAGPIIFISANPLGLDLIDDGNAHAYWYNDTAGWVDAVAVVRATVSEMETAGEVGHG